MITLRNVLQNSLLLVMLLVSSVAQPMKRQRDVTDVTDTDNQSAAKRQKVETIKLKTSDDQMIEISLGAAVISGTLKGMIDDCGQETDFSTVSLSMPDSVSQKTLQQIVQCLNVIKSGGDVEGTLKKFVQSLEINEFNNVVIAENYFDIKQLRDIFKKINAERRKIKTEHRPSELVKLSWNGAGKEQWIEVPWKIMQHTVLAEIIGDADFDNVFTVNVDSQATLEHIVDCLKIIDTNINQNNQLNAMSENLKAGALGFTNIDAVLWGNVFQSMERITLENKFKLPVALTNYVGKVTNKKLCQLANAAWYLNIVPLIDVCEKKCVECYSSNDVLSDFKFMSMKEILELPFDFSNKCAQKLSYLPELRKWLEGLAITTLNGHNNEVLAISLSQDGNTLASGSVDKTIKIWDVDTGLCKATLNGHDKLICSVCFNPKDGTLASGGRAGIIKLWKEVNGVWDCTATFNNGCDSVPSVSFSPDGTTLATGLSDVTIKLWKVNTGESLTSHTTLYGHTGSVFSVCFSHDGKTLASGSYDRTINLWNVDTGECLSTFNTWGDVNTVSFNHDSTIIAAGLSNGTIELWNVTTGECKTILNLRDRVISICFFHDSTIIAAGLSNGTIQLWNVATGKNIATLNGHGDIVSSVCFSPDGQTLVSGSHDKTIKLWNIAHIQAINYFFANMITIEQAMFLKLIHQAHKAGTAFDLTGDLKKHLREIFESLLEELQKLLVKKEMIKIKS